LRSKGDIFEQKATIFLQKQGFSIVDKNFYAKKLGEIDIIAIKDNIYHFVEVKSGENFEAIYNITPQKLNKLIKSVEYYLQKKNLEIAYQIDAIIFHKEKLEFLENITF
jgi:putative endonuclease